MIKKTAALILILMTLFVLSCKGAKNEGSEFHRGKVENNIYESSMAGFVFSPGPSWEFASNADIMQLNEIELTPDSDDAELDRELGRHSTVIDMTAQDTNTPSSIAVMYQNLNTFVGGKDTTVEEYLEKLKSEIDEKFSGYGAHAELGGCYEIAGENYSSVEVSMTISEQNVKQFYFIRRIGDYFLSVDITCSADADVERDILPLFESISQ
ncbi:MAG: hypothetical protein IKN38_06950 [Clostridia bacterium]|nr:hypothetical protein [Clostridia bacterium]